MINLTADILKAKTLLSHIKNGAPRAISNALNRTNEGVRTDVIKQVKSKYDIKSTDIRKALVAKKSYPATLQASVGSTGRPIPLIQFRVTPNNTVRALRASVKRSGGKSIPGAFLMKMSNGMTGVMIRTSTKRLPIKQLFGPSIPQMIGEASISQYVMDGVNERFAKRIDHEIAYLLEKG